ncbi:MAG: hypothetical protein QW343_01040 [Candidatus Norongarragalinales archaeon]
MLVIVFVAVFIGVFLLARSLKPSEAEYEFQGVRVLCAACGGDAQAALRAALAKPKVLMRQELVGANSSKNSVIAIVSGQIAANFRALNKTLYAFGVVDGKPLIECNEYTDYCSNQSIEVAVGACNCVRIDALRGVVRVEGSEEWFSENNYARVMTIAGIIGGAIS